MMTLFDDEFIMKAYTKDIEERAAEEAKEAAKKAAKESARKLIKCRKRSLDEIADCLPILSMDELKELEAEVMQLEQLNAF